MASDTPTLPPTGNTRIMPLAKFLGVHHHTVRRWIKQGKIPKPKTVNGIALFDNAKIHEWLNSQQSA